MIPVGAKVRVRDDIGSVFSGLEGVIVNDEAMLGYQCVVKFPDKDYSIQFLCRELEVITVTDEMLNQTQDEVIA